MKTVREEYSTFDIKRKLGIKIDRLKDWMNRGFIEPSIQKASGQGTKNLFNRFDLYMIKLLEYLINRGFSRKESARIVRELVKGTGYLIHPEWSSDKKKEIKELYDKELKRARSANYLQISRLNQPSFSPADDECTRLKTINDERGVAVIDLVDSLYGFNNKEYILNWDDILIINFKKIRDQVDAAIA